MSRYAARRRTELAPDQWEVSIPQTHPAGRVTFKAHILEPGTKSYRLRTSKTATGRKRAS